MCHICYQLFTMLHQWSIAVNEKVKYNYEYRASDWMPFYKKVSGNRLHLDVCISWINQCIYWFQERPELLDFYAHRQTHCHEHPCEDSSVEKTDIMISFVRDRMRYWEMFAHCFCLWCNIPFMTLMDTCNVYYV